MTASDFQTLLNVADVEKSIDFYALFGFAVVQNYADEEGVPQWCQLKSGEAIFMLNRQDRIDAVERHNRPDFGDAVHYISVPDADDMHRRLAAHGIAAPPPEPQMYGVLEFRLRDPDGYEIAVGSRISDEQAASDAL